MSKLDKGERGYYDQRNILNDKTGKEWIFSTKSVIDKVYPLSHQHKIRQEHGGCKPPLLCKDIIEIFTKENDKILDPYAGVGGTLLGAAESNREAIGIEINPRWKEIYEEVSTLENLNIHNIIIGDSKNILQNLEDSSFDFILTDPPFYNMDQKKKTRGKFKKVGEDSKLIPSHLNKFNDILYNSKEEWLDITSEILCLASKKLKINKYMVVFMGDMYSDGEYHDLPFDLSNAIINKSKEMNISLTRVSRLVWFDKTKRLKLFGYPFKFISSVVHTDILVFRKGD